VPKVNSGLHNKNAVDLDKIGKYMTSRNKFVTKPVEKDYDLCAGVSNEFLVYFKKVYNQHYIFKNIPSEFLVWNRTAWQQHPISFLNPQKRFTILADGAKSPQIIELSNHIIGCLFTVSKKYQETRIILENYLKHTIAIIIDTDYRAEKINSSAMGVKEIIFLQDESRARAFDTYSKQLSQKLKDHQDLEFIEDFIAEPEKFKHSGLACRKIEVGFIENNAIITVSH
jgi:hypothetical protein